MQSLRIALGLVALVIAWIVMVPSGAIPTPPERTEMAAVGELNSQAQQSAPEPQRTETQSPDIRAIIPSPIAPDTQLTRLPSVSSGAAVPPVARLPSMPVEPASPEEDASSQSGAAVASVNAADVTKPVDPNKPDFRLFNHPIALDTGTIQSGETTIHLAGISSIAPDARCVEGTRSWPCGIVARTAFRGWLRGRTLMCAVPPQGSVEEPLACLMGEADVGDWLVRNGWANAEPGSRYETAAAEAKAQGRGIWQFEIEN